MNQQDGFRFPGDVVSDGEGGAFVTWSDQRGGNEEIDVYLQHVTAQGEIAWRQYPGGFPFPPLLRDSFSPAWFLMTPVASSRCATAGREYWGRA